MRWIIVYYYSVMNTYSPSSSRLNYISSIYPPLFVPNVRWVSSVRWELFTDACEDKAAYCFVTKSSM